ncbi:MAG TPA: hypothetical protein VMI75_37210 [Polyangiaceae bacterium]|nr:hypothetical protein [Polyangiaceae bacterium]
MSANDTVLRDLAGKLPARPNARLRMLWIVCVVIGAASFAFLLFRDPVRAWGSWAINLFYFVGIAEGGVVLASAIRLSNGRWGGPVLRIGESFSSFMPFGMGAAVVLLAAGGSTYLPWMKHVEPRQAPFLNVPFLWIRTIGGLALFWWLSRKLARTSLRADLHLLKDHVSPERKAEYEKLCANWKGDEAEKAWYRHEVAHLSPQLVLTFAVFFSVLSWDLIMALTPNWVSDLFGWFCYGGAFITGIAMTTLIAVQARRRMALEAYITTNMFWDLGKILFAWSIFWGYLFWSQYLPIWYANMPEETWWVFLRFEDPWRPLAFTVFTMVFVIPLIFLLNKTSKTNPVLLTGFCLVSLTGIWLERHVLVMPSLNPDQVWLGLPEVGVMLGFLGLFGWSVQGFLSRYPIVRVADVLEGAGGHGH